MFVPRAFPESLGRALRRLRRAEVSLRLPILNLCVALWLLALLNVPFWRALWQATGGWQTDRAGFLLSLPLFVLLWVWLLLEGLTWGRAAKPVLALLLITSAAAAYFMNVYGIVLDRSIIANIVETDPAEAIELLSPRMLGWLLAFGALPLWLLTRVRVPRQSWHQSLLAKAMTLGVLLSGAAVVIAPFFQSVRAAAAQPSGASAHPRAIELRGRRAQLHEGTVDTQLQA